MDTTRTAGRHAGPAPSLTTYAELENARGVVLMLHGGKDRGHQTVDGRSASWRRSAAMAHALADDVAAAGVALHLLRWTMSLADARPAVRKCSPARKEKRLGRE